jgi:hypothetical protein
VPNYRQVAWVVRDVDRATEQWWSLLGVGPWDIRSFTNETVRDFEVDGRRVEEPFEFVCAVTWVGDVELELIQPVEGPNIYWRHLEEHGEGMHHVKDVMSDEECERTIERFREQGHEVIQTGWIDGDVHYYFDTAATLGSIYEIGNGGPIGPPPRRYPPDA